MNSWYVPSMYTYPVLFVGLIFSQLRRMENCCNERASRSVPTTLKG